MANLYLILGTDGDIEHFDWPVCWCPTEMHATLKTDEMNEAHLQLLDKMREKIDGGYRGPEIPIGDPDWRWGAIQHARAYLGDPDWRPSKNLYYSWRAIPCGVEALESLEYLTVQLMELTQPK